MKLSFKSTRQKLTRTDLLVVFSKENSQPNLPDGVELPQSALTAFEGKQRSTRWVDPVSGPAKRVLLIGLGDGEFFDPETLRRCGAIATKQAEKSKSGSVTLWFDFSDLEEAEYLGQALSEGVVMGAYRLDEFKSDPDSPSLQRVLIQATDAGFTRGAKKGETIGRANCFARRLQDTPGNLMRPTEMVAEAKAIAAASEKVTISVMDEKKMKQLGMGSLLSVSKGSEEPAFLIHLTYKPTKKSGKKICLVGKGLTFDAGGISIKPSSKMDEMKYDMSGGAAVLGAFQAIAELQPGIEIHGLVPVSENLPDGKANKPGDLVVAMNGMSIEVLNTDAEGRLILADAMCYAVEKIKPDAMIDLATLTGAVLVALGHEYTGAMGNDDDLIDAIVTAGKHCGELVWPLPIHKVHKDDMKGKVGDLKNISSPGTGAGSSTAGAFLSNFAGEIPWVHLDIAGSAWGGANRDYQNGSQGTGVGVRLLLDWIESL